MLCLISSCSDNAEDMSPCEKQPCKVGFYAGGPLTRTSICDDGLSSEWNPGDQLSVWAVGSDGAKVLDNIGFAVYGLNGGQAFFTATLDSEMPEDTYTYYASYPAPLSVSGTSADFEIPSVQDGRLSDGADILIAAPVTYGPLRPVPEILDGSGLSMPMEHLLHQFRLYMPEDQFNGEPVKKIELTFPRGVVGRLTADYTNPDAAASLSDATSTVTLLLDEPLAVSTADDMNFAVASFFPTQFAAGEAFDIKAYASTQICFASVDLQGRTFERGHSTPVRLRIDRRQPYWTVNFTVSGNNLGEDADAVILTAPEGCTWGDTGSNVYTYTPGHKITTGETFAIKFESEDIYRALSGREIAVSFDCEHVTTNGTLTMPDMSSGLSTDISAGLPYLLYEDFSAVESFSSDDAYTGGINFGSKGAHSFLNGWTGARIGAEAGKCVRIACRRETSSDYPARVDSAPFVLKKAADIVVHFDYGANNQYSGNANVGQTLNIGYVTSEEGYKSGDGTGTFKESFYIKEYSGSYDNTPNSKGYTIPVPEGLVRISWKSDIEHKAGFTNTTAWFYIDNVTVQIANNN